MAAAPRTVRLLAGPFLAVVAGLFVGVLAGWAAVAVLVGLTRDDSPWGDLAGVVLGLMVGAVVGVVVWVIGLVVAARRQFPRGRRGGAVGLTMAAAATVVVGLTLLVEALDVGDAGGALGFERRVLVALLAVAASSAMFPLWDRFGGARHEAPTVVVTEVADVPGVPGVVGVADDESGRPAG
ncbi:hypothetical protein [Cellulomonas sp. KRMCY2]|uniref:hypothetical protein n=1 Tax=Cellulomonas sp. KRMCY2 TaxID=1304865 RepID=UPI00045E9DC1|nr:hypothetical protein [Cellulomonas sp. KRMCY2]